MCKSKKQQGIALNQMKRIENMGEIYEWRMPKRQDFWWLIDDRSPQNSELWCWEL
jgi:hypothetical protein